jgi:hypothetical protein
MDGGIGTVIGYVAHYSAWEMDCAGVTKTAVFVPPYTWTAGSQTVTAAVQSTGFSTALLALTAPGHTPWTSQKRVWYSSGTGPDHLWSGGYNQMDVTATAFNYAVIYPDWATHHQLRLEASLTLGSAQAMFDRTLTYTAVPLAAVLPFPSNPFFTVLPTDAARTAVIPLDNAFPINFGKLEMGQLSGGVTRFWTVFFDQGTYNLQAPLTLTLPPTPATAAFHGFVPGQTTITNAYFYERPGYDLYTAIDSFPITNEVETYQIHDVGTW